MFMRNIIMLVKMCSEDPESVDMQLFNELVEYGYIDEKGNLTEYGKKLLDEFLESSP